MAKPPEIVCHIGVGCNVIPVVGPGQVINSPECLQGLPSLFRTNVRLIFVTKMKV
jgi:hypothetical protein